MHTHNVCFYGELKKIFQSYHQIPFLIKLSDNREQADKFRTLLPVNQDPGVQSVVSLTSSLRVISLTVLADSMYNILIFFAEKMWVALHCKSYSHFFSKKFQQICVSLDVNFNKSLSNDIVSFEQLGPDDSLSATTSEIIPLNMCTQCRFRSVHIHTVWSESFWAHFG